ncbi:hypothetical protein [Bradyrhizobium stylosanthis]|uniref:Uncharacterized protein n=1 Tax=Bradyrhizobium stylosanthis TaxID=1803665 RepID=A0A560CXM8_9BRAD|nr:hypothetical protein [Bradyrhizobium stylosanthis]TWA89600.1 hypothetical protein FBZ96_11968 [Bradyrhizobium stylosanthis]
MIEAILKQALAGVWGEVWRFGLGYGICICLAIAAYVSPVFKKQLAYAALAVFIFMVAFTSGVITGEKRVRAQWAAADELTLKANEAARARAERSVGRKPAGRVRDDRNGPDCRDCEDAVRSVAPHHLFQR